MVGGIGTLVVVGSGSIYTTSGYKNVVRSMGDGHNPLIKMMMMMVVVDSRRE